MSITLADIAVRIPGKTGPLFSIPSAEITAGSRILVHGPSGCGKTTLLHIIAGQFLPDQGRINVLGRELTSMDAESRSLFRRRHLGIVFQRLNLINHLNPLENILLGMPDSSGKDVEKAKSALIRMGLEAALKQGTASLSPGEQQRVAVARVLASGAEIVLADEPTSSLDDANAEVVMQALCGGAEGRTLVVVSHDQRVRKYFDETWDFSQWTVR